MSATIYIALSGQVKGWYSFTTTQVLNFIHTRVQAHSITHNLRVAKVPNHSEELIVNGRYFTVAGAFWHP